MKSLAMNHVRRQLFRLLLVLLPGIALAQIHPPQPLTIIVPFPPGGIADASVRVIAARLADNMGRPVLVDNRSGAGGQVGAAVARHAKPDGNTLFLANIGTHAINRSLYDKLSYDPVKDFEPVTELFSWTHVLVVPASSKATSLESLIAEARAKPGKLVFASQGVGSGGHLLGEMFKSSAHIEVEHVPYRGSAQAMQDLLSGRIDFFFDGVGVLPFVKDGKVKALAVTDVKRLAQLPDVPTMGELGHPAVEMSAWFGIVAPSGTPQAVISKLNQDFVKAAKDPDVVKRLGDGVRIDTGSPDSFGAFMASETDRLGRIVKASGARAD
ncbi:MAG: tripartite tricarboxylate transporter substrate binding protein [Variovorax sp.]|nr:tripartite tricarboxylate transporter substrate binding protein [Variovorax sp.]